MTEENTSEDPLRRTLYTTGAVGAAYLAYKAYRYMEEPLLAGESGEKVLSDNLKHQAHEILPAEPGFSKTLAHKHFGKTDNPVMTCKLDCWTLWENSARENASDPAVYYRHGGSKGPYKSWTYASVLERTESIAAGMAALPDLGARNIGIWSKNRPEWFMTALACWRQKCTVVPFYETLGDEAMAHILGQAEIGVMFTEAEKLPKILKLLQSDFMRTQKCYLHTIYVWNTTTSSTGLVRERQGEAQTLDQMFAEHGMPNDTAESFRLVDIELKRFCDLPQVEIPPKDLDDSEGIAVIMYTSGTTGMPKGVMLHHGCLSVIKDRIQYDFTDYPNMPKKFRYYSYLPLAHIFEMAMHMAVLSNGGSLWYFCGNIKGLVEDLACVRPHIFTGVPRVYQKFYDKVQLSMKSGVLAWLLWNAFDGQSYYIRKQQGRSMMYDMLLRVVAKKIGLEQCQLMISGAAPLASFLHEFLLTLVPGVAVQQGYGMTETACHGTISHKEDIWGGTVGAPVPTALIKLRDVPEMGRLVTNSPPDGEILIGGPNVFRGYYKMPEKTAEDLMEHNGQMWVCTGDIGVLKSDGTIAIVDRKKNIFKLAQGEYIAVEKIEMCYAAAESVNQIWVYGNSFKTCVVAVVVPALPWWYENFTNKTMPEKDFPKAVADFQAWYSPAVAPKLKEAIMKDLQNHQKGLKGFEKVKGVVIAPDMNELMISFNPENELLTPSMKLRRLNLKRAFLQELKDLYGELGQPAQDGENWE